MIDTKTARSMTADKLRLEGLIDLVDAGKLCPTDNAKGHCSAGTLLRWIVSGKRRIRLEACRERGQWWTSREAVARFIQATR